MTHTTPVPHEGPEWAFMAKALKGELTEEEQKAFSVWLGQNETHAIQWAEAMETWQKVETVQNNNFEPNVPLAWQKFCAINELHPSILSPALPQEATVRPMFAWGALTKYAALFVLAAGLAWLGYTQFYASEQWAQVATLSGQRKAFYLPDSSRVVLNENSMLRYQEDFTGNERKVELTGEGFFEVKKNPKKPFIVNSGNTQTKVLGTSFNVKALQKAQEVTVTVLTGKVAFSSLKTNNRFILTPGFTGKMHANGNLQKVVTNQELTPSWQSLKFEGASLKEMEKSLESYFGVEITISNTSLQRCTFTGTFHQPELKEILAVLSASSGFSISQSSANTYLFSGAGCQ